MYTSAEIEPTPFGSPAERILATSSPKQVLVSVIDVRKGYVSLRLTNPTGYVLPTLRF